MLPSNPIETMDVYASNSQYVAGPTREQQANGTIPLDTLPADWWNWLWKQITERINQASSGMEAIYDEVMSVLDAANIEPSQLQSDQLLNAIKALARVTGTAAIAGAVKSSSDSGKISIDTNGIMSVNGLGIPTSLNTTVKNIVGAINEILADYEQHKTTTDSLLQGLENNKAPNNHASEDITYGKGTGSTYGHVKLYDGVDKESGQNEGVAATPTAVKSAYDTLYAMLMGSDHFPTRKDDNPILNASAGQSGTLEIAQAGFYLIQMRGGHGGNGGLGGLGSNTAVLGYPLGGLGGGGEFRQKIVFLLPGTYNYIVGGTGGVGTNGGGSYLVANTGGGGGGGGGAGGNSAFYNDDGLILAALGGAGGGGGGGNGCYNSGTNPGGGAGGSGATSPSSSGAAGATAPNGVGGAGGAAGTGYSNEKLLVSNMAWKIHGAADNANTTTKGNGGAAGNIAAVLKGGDGTAALNSAVTASGSIKVWKLV